MKTLRYFALCCAMTALAAAAPILRLSETTIGPVSIAAGQNGPTRSVEMTNVGDGNLQVSLSSNATWATATLGAARPCSVFGSGSGSCTPINVALQTASLAAGVHSAMVVVADPNALDAPQTIIVTVAIGGTIPSAVDLYVSTQAGSRDSVKVTANGLLQGVPATTGGGNWLSLAFEGNGSFAFVLPYAITAINPGGLAAGNYTGTLAVTSLAQPLNNKTVNATLHVTADPIASVSASSVSLRAAAGAPAQIANLIVSNRGQGTLQITNVQREMTNGEGWLTAELIAGTGIVQVRATAGALAPGIYRGTVRIETNAANGPATIPVQFEVTAAGNPLLSAGGVVNNATYAGGDALARGTIAAVFGEQLLFADPIAASALPLQNEMGGVRVLINGAPSPVYFVSYGQINFQVPYDAPTGMATVVVESAGKRSNGVSVRIEDRAPRILRLGIGEYGILVNPDGTFPLPASAGLGAAARPARPGETLVVYAIGLGPTSPTVASGAGAPSSPLAVIDPYPTVHFNGRLAPSDAATPLFAGLTPGFVGLYQINITLPPSVERGPRVQMTLKMGEQVTSNTVELAIE